MLRFFSKHAYVFKFLQHELEKTSACFFEKPIFFPQKRAKVRKNAPKWIFYAKYTFYFWLIIEQKETKPH